MKFLSFSLLLFTFRVLAGDAYSKYLDITGSAFYDEFSFVTSADPTHGRVTYVDRQFAHDHNLTYVTNGTFFLRADYTTYLLPSDPGRNSFRLTSIKQFLHYTAIFDILHMPEGCGTWPAVWTLGSDWPNQGEIDILEGVNNVTPNTAALHTGSNCTMPSSREMTGRSIGSNCAAYETGNKGCGVQFSNLTSFGPLFNANRGGWYALQHTGSDIKIWFWPRSDVSVPKQVQFSSFNGVIEPETWTRGVPDATWSNEKCNFGQHFGFHKIVINLTFCGDWAGAVYPDSGCPSTCEDYVNNNPSAFYNAYFAFSAIRIFIPVVD